MNQDRLLKMTKKQLAALIWRLTGWIDEDADLWEQEDIRRMFNMGVLE